MIEWQACRPDGSDPSLSLPSREAALNTARGREVEAAAHGDTDARYVVQWRAIKWQDDDSLPARTKYPLGGWSSGES